MKRNGFTLIELLAVIVVLAIIALIATLIVLNIINNAKKSSNERSGELYVKAVENAIMKKQMNGTDTVELNTTYVVDTNGNICKSTYYESASDSEKTTFACPTNDIVEVSVDGDKPVLGSTITVDTKGVVTAYKLTISGTEIVKGEKAEENESNTEIPNELKEYVLGTNLQGRNAYEILNVNDMTFLDGATTIKDASSSIEEKNILVWGENIYFIISYKDNYYSIKVNNECNTLLLTNFDNISDMVGKQVTYNGNEYTVLYDYGNGIIEMIANNAIGSLTLGKEDTLAQGTTDEEKAINSYNNAILRLNNYCLSFYEGDGNIISVRSVGINPQNFNIDDTMYSNSDLNSYDEILKASNEDILSDLLRMYLTDSYETSNGQVGYFIAGRKIDHSRNRYDFEIDYMNIDSDWSDWRIGSDILFDIYLDGPTHSHSVTRSVKPIIKINSSFVTEI